MQYVICISDKITSFSHSHIKRFNMLKSNFFTLQTNDKDNYISPVLPWNQTKIESRSDPPGYKNDRPSLAICQMDFPTREIKAATFTNFFSLLTHSETNCSVLLFQSGSYLSFFHLRFGHYFYMNFGSYTMINTNAPTFR